MKKLKDKVTSASASPVKGYQSTNENEVFYVYKTN
jgi:hypothetical protein